MKLYTGTGDRGKTSLFSGERRPKNHARIEAYGAVDELSACLGALAAAWPSPPDGNISDENLSSQSGSQAPAWSLEQIAEIQSDLFTAGAWLATTPQSAERDTLA
ncbi:MAG: ATP:cob(I)alamin adenosyltransferase, partial [Desulfobacterales bacterium]